jgi:hypothetical protein
MLNTQPVVPVAPRATASNYHWLVTVRIMLGAFIVIMDGMIVNIALVRQVVPEDQLMESALALARRWPPGRPDGAQLS